MAPENKSKKKYVIIMLVSVIVFVGVAWKTVDWYRERQEYRSEHPAYIYEPAKVSIEQIDDLTQRATQIDDGYSFTFPANWLIEEPDGLKTGFRILPPEESLCHSFGISKWENPEQKTALDLIIDDHTPIDVHYDISNYEPIEGAYMLISRSERSQSITKSVLVPNKDGEYIHIGVKADDPLPLGCEQLISNTLDSLKFK
jgi:hypothetical protein